MLLRHYKGEMGRGGGGRGRGRRRRGGKTREILAGNHVTELYSTAYECIKGPSPTQLHIHLLRKFVAYQRKCSYTGYVAIQGM